MDKKEHHEAPSGKPIAQKLIAKLQRRLGKAANLAEVVNSSVAAEELQRGLVEGLAGFHPAHAAYVYTQNQVSVMSEHLTALKEMAPFAEVISKAEELYMPSAPPMSPLTTSCFTCWAFFDACAGAANETIGTTILEFGAVFGIHSELLHLIRLMQDSRMGIYIYKGRKHNLAVLEDLVTGAACSAIVPSGYHGKEGELWYARILPPPIQGSAEHVVFTTPYILLQPGPHDWLAYFSRAFPQPARVDDYERHMKYGPTREYWNDFVFEAYVNYRTEAIYLAGLPDIPESRPHSKVNSWGFGIDSSTKRYFI
jgi:hypothetical protein